MRVPKNLVNTEYLRDRYKVSRQLLKYYRQKGDLETVKLEDSSENFYNLEQVQSLLSTSRASHTYQASQNYV